MQDMTNIVALKGKLGCCPIKRGKLCGLEYEHYYTTIQTTRRSGVLDTANIIIPAEQAAAVEKITEESEQLAEVAIMCIGKLQTLKDRETGRVFLYVLADFVGLLTGEHYEEENAVHIEAAALGKQPIYRETPKGKHITDTTLRIPNKLRPHSNCFVPTIFWGKEAEEVSKYKEGDCIAVSGRLQSREYNKVIDECTQELRVAYELSVCSIDSIKPESEEINE